MTLTPEQVNDIKEQLKSQVQHLPADKKQQALEEIKALSSEAVESLVKQQSRKGQSEKSEKEKTVFRMIIDGDIPSTKVDENKIALAVLDINPISKGHIIIIPKSPVGDATFLSTKTFIFAKKLAKKLTLKLKAKSTEIQTESKFNETIINLIPCYNEPLNINSPRSKSSPEQLQEIAKLLKPVKKSKVEKIKIKTQKSSENQILKLKRRIP